MELRLYFRMLQKGWWLIVLTTLIAVFASLTFSYLVTPQYTAKTRLILTPGSLLTSQGDAQVLISGLETLDLRSVVATYTEVMASQRILDEALTTLGVQNFSRKEYIITAVALPESSVLELSITGPDPVLATDLTNSIGYQTILFTRGLNRVYELNVLDKAVIPDTPVSPKPLQDAGLSLLLGLVGGAVLAILSEQIRVPLEAYRHRLQLDADTGVYNNRYFARLLETQVSENPSDPFSIGVFELSGLADYLDSLPVPGLQRVLSAVTNTLRRELRGNDNIGRWNKNSFIVLLPMTKGEAASRIFTRIQQALLMPVELPQYDLSLQLDPHVGGGEYSGDITMQELLDKTAAALEQAKRDSSNPVYVWELKNPFWVQKD
ncbi:hypothetical protein MASR2M66_17200 [Chloroflexota bacterium]